MANTPEKNSATKSLAIVGFVGLIIVISWLGIQLVQVMPTALSSLASLADSVYNYEPVSLTVVSNKTVANVDEPFTISWNVPRQEGKFAFSYACAEGLSVDLRDQNGIKAINCDTNYDIGSVSSIDLVAKGERSRYTDLAYTIDFITIGHSEPTGNGTGRVSIVNPAIEDTVAVGPVEPEPETPVATTTPTNTPATTTPAAPTTPSTPTKPTTTYTTEYVYTIPTSDPNGYTDLVARHLGVGAISGGKFISRTTIDNDTEGAIQFEVKNTGTKTSATWNYTVILPNGDTYNSPLQNPLKPQERKTIVIGFPTNEDTGTETYTVAVSVGGDKNLANNSFAERVTVVE